MRSKQKIKLIKKLESLVIFQKDCLDSGNWNDYDTAEEKIREVENQLSSIDSASLEKIAEKT